MDSSATRPSRGASWPRRPGRAGARARTLPGSRLRGDPGAGLALGLRRALRGDRQSRPALRAVIGVDAGRHGAERRRARPASSLLTAARAQRARSDASSSIRPRNRRRPRGQWRPGERGLLGHARRLLTGAQQPRARRSIACAGVAGTLDADTLASIGGAAQPPGRLCEPSPEAAEALAGAAGRNRGWRSASARVRQPACPRDVLGLRRARAAAGHPEPRRAPGRPAARCVGGPARRRCRSWAARDGPARAASSPVLDGPRRGVRGRREPARTEGRAVVIDSSDAKRSRAAVAAVGGASAGARHAAGSATESTAIPGSEAADRMARLPGTAAAASYIAAGRGATTGGRGFVLGLGESASVQVRARRQRAPSRARSRALGGRLAHSAKGRSRASIARHVRRCVSLLEGVGLTGDRRRCRAVCCPTCARCSTLAGGARRVAGRRSRTLPSWCVGPRAAAGGEEDCARDPRSAAGRAGCCRVDRARGRPAALR